MALLKKISLKARLVASARRLLARAGFELRRSDLPACSFEETLRSLREHRGAAPPEGVHVFDDDCWMQRRLGSVFGADRLHFHSHDSQSSGGEPAPSIPVKGNFWLVLSLSQWPFEDIFAANPWAAKAGMILVRGKLDQFTASDAGYGGVTARLAQQLQMAPVDACLELQTSSFNAGSSNVVLVYGRDAQASAGGSSPMSIARLGHARAFLSRPLGAQAPSRILSPVQGFHYAGGVFNPGAIRSETGFSVLARAETATWLEQEKSRRLHFTSWKPLLLDLSLDCTVCKGQELKFDSNLDASRIRCEDFRLFGMNGSLFCNHSLISLPGQAMPDDSPVKLHEQLCKIAVSEVRPEDGVLRFVGFPSLPVQTGRMEKNWAMFVHEDRLCLIHSMQPYRLFCLADLKSLRFAPGAEAGMQGFLGGNTGMIRNSINPVEYDDEHYLHVCHQVLPGKQYVFWPLLLRKSTLLPAFVGRTPILRACPALPASIVYLSSAVALPEKVLLFCGLNDRSSAVVEVGRAAIDAAWCQL